MGSSKIWYQDSIVNWEFMYLHSWDHYSTIRVFFYVYFQVHPLLVTDPLGRLVITLVLVQICICKSIQMKLECTYFQFSYYTMGSLQCFIMEKPSKICWNNIHSVAKSITSQIFQPLFVWNSSTSTTFSFLSNTLFKLIMPDREVRSFQNPVTSALVLLQSPYSQSVLICLLMWQLLA